MGLLPCSILGDPKNSSTGIFEILAVSLCSKTDHMGLQFSRSSKNPISGQTPTLFFSFSCFFDGSYV